MTGLQKLGCISVAVLCFVSCVGGGGTDTETGGTNISGIIVSSDGHPAMGVRTMLIPSSFNPLALCRLGDSLIDTTDADGRYSFHVDSGVYNIQALHAGDGTRLFLAGIRANSPDVALPMDTLKLPGKIKVSLDTELTTQGGFVYLVGSTVKTSFAKGAASAVLDSVPLGNYPEVRFTESDSCNFLILYKNVPVDTPESIVDLPDSI